MFMILDTGAAAIQRHDISADMDAGVA